LVVGKIIINRNTGWMNKEGDIYLEKMAYW